MILELDKKKIILNTSANAFLMHLFLNLRAYATK